MSSCGNRPKRRALIGNVENIDIHRAWVGSGLANLSMRRLLLASDRRDAATICGRANILKRLLVHTGAFNLGLLMRTLIGVGTPRGLQRRLVVVLAVLWTYLVARWSDDSRPVHDRASTFRPHMLTRTPSQSA